MGAATKGCSQSSRFLKAKKFLNEGCHFISSVLNVCLIEGYLIFFPRELCLVWCTGIAGGQLVSISVFCVSLLVKDVTVPYDKYAFIIWHSLPPHT